MFDAWKAEADIDAGFYTSKLYEENLNMSRTKLLMFQLAKVLLQKPRLVLVSAKAHKSEFLMKLLLKNAASSTVLVAVEQMETQNTFDPATFDKIIHIDKGMIRSVSEVNIS